MNTPETRPLIEGHVRVVGVCHERPELKANARASLEVALSSEDGHDGA